jgi:hypothetical protein
MESLQIFEIPESACALTLRIDENQFFFASFVGRSYFSVIAQQTEI